MRIVLCILLAYLIGSISTSTLLTRWLARIDIRDHGSGNAGATNTLRVLGVKWGLFVLVVDALKGVVAVEIARIATGGHLWPMYLAGLAAIVGHNWPVFFGFRGGKGIATTIGVYLMLVPIPVVLAGIVALILILVTRFVSLGALILVILTPILCGLLGHHWGAVVFTAIVAILSIYRHQENIVRLVQGKEHRIFSKRI
jgi:glycerol-3-phosphate acyltransferase PlsY